MKNLEKRTAEAIEFTRFITEKWNDRLTGRKACQETGEYLYEKFSLFSDKQFKQDFKINPNAFLGFIRVCIALYVLNLICMLANLYILSIGIGLLSCVILVFEFFLYYKLLDPFFPAKKGTNIYAFLEPKEEVKQQIIISAHHDSAHVFNFYEKNPENYYIKINLGMGGLILSVFLSIIMFFVSSDMVLLTLKGIATLISIVVLPLWNFIDTKRGTPGAGDNIICTAVTFEILKYYHTLKLNGDGLKNTRIIIGSWDAEEAGLRGAKAFVKEHKSMLHAVPTFNYNLECLYEYSQLNFTTNDINSFVKLSEKMADDCIAISANLGYKVKKTTFPLLAGATDAGEFARGGIEAITLSGMTFGELATTPVYHTTRDTVDKIDPKAVTAAIDIGIEYIAKKDKELNTNH